MGIRQKSAMHFGGVGRAVTSVWEEWGSFWDVISRRDRWFGGVAGKGDCGVDMALNQQ